MGRTTPSLRRIGWLLLLAAASAVQGPGSVVVPRQEGHFVFTAAWPENSAPGKKSRAIVPLDPKGGDAFGVIGSLFITVDWWTLFGEPVENYIVEWTASGRFQVKDSTGAIVTVTREEVERYPDLKLRFAQLKPKALDFTVWYRLDYSGILSAADRATLDKRYRDLRQSGDTHYEAERLVKNSQFLIAGSGTTPLSAPGSHSWSDFVSSYVTTNYDVTRYMAHQKPIIADILKRARSIEIMNVRVSRLEMPESEMRVIADKLRKYREGQADPTPLEQIAAAQQQSVAAYAAQDEWAEPASEPQPAVPPKPVRAADGLYYFVDPTGRRVFARGFPRAYEFNDEGFAVVFTRDSGKKLSDKRINYLDRKGNLLLSAEEESWGSGLYSISWGDLVTISRGELNKNSGGLYSAKQKRFIIPLEQGSLYGWSNKNYPQSMTYRRRIPQVVGTAPNATRFSGSDWVEYAQVRVKYTDITYEVQRVGYAVREIERKEWFNNEPASAFQ